MKVLLRHTYTCLTLLCTLTILYSCNGDRAFRERLTSIDSLLQTCPDSAYNILSSIEDEAQDQASSNRMYYELLRADGQNKAYVSFTTDSVMKQVAQYYEDHGTPNQQMRAYYLLGCTYRDMGDAPTELEYFQRAVESADTTASDCDYHTLVAVYGQMAEIYSSQALPQEELTTLSMCEEYAIKSNDHLTAISAYELRLRAYYDMNMPDSVLYISKKAREKYLAIGNSRKAARLLNPAISILLDRGEYAQAKIYMDIFKNESDYFTGNEITSPTAYIHYRSLGRYALHNNQIDSAKHFFYKLIEKGEYEAAYQGLLCVYEETAQADSVLKYSKLYALANDSSHNNKYATSISQMTAMYNYGREKRNAEAANEQLLIEKGKTTTLLLIILIFVFAIILLIYISSQKHKKTIEKIKALNQDIEHKTLLLNKSNNEEELQSLKASLANAHEELMKYKKSDTLSAFFDSETYKLFYEISIKGHCKITNEEWGTMSRLFYSTFSQYTDFIHSGKSMTEDQIKICMLIRIGFGETEMANIMSTDLKRISRIKMQINQKLFGVANARDLLKNLKSKF